MNTDIPDYLYHYTSIETLALILKNKTIRFNSLCNVDDLQEQKTDDIQNWGRLVFVSCWTSYDEESIPMWSMYAKHNNSVGGVRLKLKTNPFEEYVINSPNIGFDKSNATICNGEARTIEPLKMINKYLFIPPSQKDLLAKVEYTNDKNKLNPKIYLSDEQKNAEMNVGYMGKFKNPYWKFQNEWRYVLAILPFSLIPLDLCKAKNDSQNLQSNIEKGLVALPFENVDLKIEEQTIKNIEIMLSPTRSDAVRIIVEALIDKYCPSANIFESSLRNYIKA